MISELIANKEIQYEIAKMVFLADLSNPSVFRSREFRSLTDHSVREAWERKFRAKKELNSAADLVWGNDRISLKRQDYIFPRPWVNNPKKMTVYQPVVIANALHSDALTFDADYLFAYHPQDKNQLFTYGIMTAEKVIEKTSSHGDQWILKQTKDEDWLIKYSLPRQDLNKVDVVEFKKRKTEALFKLFESYYQDSYNELLDQIVFQPS